MSFHDVSRVCSFYVVPKRVLEAYQGGLLTPEAVLESRKAATSAHHAWTREEEDDEERCVMSILDHVDPKTSSQLKDPFIEVCQRTGSHCRLR
jgi:hypothetical protein